MVRPPFWHHAFLLGNSKDLRELLSTSIKEVWIDPEKGRDVEDGKSKNAVVAEVDDTLARFSTGSKISHRADITHEAVRAVNIYAESRQAVASMFLEARMGKAWNASVALSVVEKISASVMHNPGALISLPLRLLNACLTHTQVKLKMV